MPQSSSINGRFKCIGGKIKIHEITSVHSGDTVDWLCALVNYKLRQDFGFITSCNSCFRDHFKYMGEKLRSRILLYW